MSTFTVIVNIAPLRQRREDILPIFEMFLHKYSQQYGSASRRLAPDAQELLLRYRWPGNVRELRNIAERMVVLLRKVRSMKKTGRFTECMMVFSKASGIITIFGEVHIAKGVIGKMQRLIL